MFGTLALDPSWLALGATRPNWRLFCAVIYLISILFNSNTVQNINVMYRLLKNSEENLNVVVLYKNGNVVLVIVHI